MPHDHRIRVLVTDPATARNLKDYLRSPRFELVTVDPAKEFVEVARHEHPGIAVLGPLDDRREAVESEIDVLKATCPAVRIIALSAHPSPDDGRVVEHGVFYYLADRGPGDLVRVVEAAAQSLSRDRRDR